MFSCYFYFIVFLYELLSKPVIGSQYEPIIFNGINYYSFGLYLQLIVPSR